MTALTRRQHHECVLPEVDERGTEEYRYICPVCKAVWDYTRGMIREQERRGFWRRVVQTWYPGNWFCIHRPEVWEPVDGD